VLKIDSISSIIILGIRSEICLGGQRFKPKQKGFKLYEKFKTIGFKDGNFKFEGVFPTLQQQKAPCELRH
jgi:hypothetical protein